jgi:hypothetical protein
MEFSTLPQMDLFGNHTPPKIIVDQLRSGRTFHFKGLTFVLAPNRGNYLTVLLRYRGLHRKEEQAKARELYTFLCDQKLNRCSYCKDRKLTKATSILGYLLQEPVPCCHCYADIRHLDAWNRVKE